MAELPADRTMTLDAYQVAARRFQQPTCTGLAYLVPGLAAEAGEVAGKHAKWIRGDYGDDLDAFKADLAKEIGDVQWFLAGLAGALGLPLSAIAAANIDKLDARLTAGTIMGSGDNR